MSHQHEIAWFRLWRSLRCIFRCWMAGRGLVKQRDVPRPSRSTRGQCLRQRRPKSQIILASPRATGMWRTRRSSFCSRFASVGKFSRFRADRHRSNRASGRTRCVLWGLSDGSRRAQTKTIKRNCFSSAFCYCKEERCAERCDDPRRRYIEAGDSCETIRARRHRQPRQAEISKETTAWEVTDSMSSATRVTPNCGRISCGIATASDNGPQLPERRAWLTGALASGVTLGRHFPPSPTIQEWPALRRATPLSSRRATEPGHPSARRISLSEARRCLRGR